MDTQVLRYASDALTLWQLKKGETSLADMTAVSKFITENKISARKEGDPDYPFVLAKIKNPPKILFYQGDPNLLHKPLISIVGPRDMTPYAQEVLKALFAVLKNYDVVTVSGLAEGVDQACHTLSLEQGIPTIAVLGIGLWNAANGIKGNLMRKILEAWGLVMSEFPLSFAGAPWSFPQRNRIVAGLARVVFLPEASPDSGSLITLNLANEMSVPVYGTPNNRTSDSSRGLHEAMSQGKAHVVSDMKLFLDTFFKATSVEKKRALPDIILTDDEKKLLTILVAKPCTMQELVVEMWLDMWGLMGILTMLEIKGLLKQDAFGRYRLA